ncbi:hypothetical protein GIB67_005281 [Kingdonia uniflora]|uniref:Uncharacterized protein n=1 Tax=Kingdonia uniflora TaxID=39325 RepID=A0A7J7L8A5_9MAGN|nr:hypothetical protein GIB67_005281 [Kingdonia uniflora]
MLLRPVFSRASVERHNLLWVSGECLQRSVEEPLELNNRTIQRFARALRDVQLDFQDREALALKLKEVRAESEAEAERLLTALAISGNNLAGKLYQLRYTKAEELDFAKEREEQTLLNNAEYAEEYEVLFSQYEDRLDDNEVFFKTRRS